jgi:2-keto-4-pentenoate hydratase/2-oxohepta-3-ene-1,7-dioic acid hydratase in catechol pathway
VKIGMAEIAGRPRLVVVLPDRESVSKVVDVSAVAAELNGYSSLSGVTLQDVIQGGDDAREVIQDTIDAAVRRGNIDCWHDLDSVRWLVPIHRPARFICAGRNFAKHVAEGERDWAQLGVKVSLPDIPVGFLSLANALSAHNEAVRRHPDVVEFDYEVEVGAVVGRAGTDIPESDALSHVFGYTVFNDLSAREWQQREMLGLTPVLGKNFPGCAALGPWVVTADEVGEPADLRIELTVNGEPRQAGSCRDMIFSFPKLISHWSQIGLEPGDILTSGTCEGVAHRHRPDPSEWYLKPGDVVTASVAKIGALTSRIVP